MGSLKILLRNILAALAGAFLAFLLVFVAQLISGRFYPPPEGLNYRDPVAMGNYIQTLPVGAFVAVLLGYFIGVTAGAWLATRISVSRHERQGMMVGVLFFIASLVNLLSLPHPIWFWVANLAIIPIAAWIGMRFGEPDERPLD